MKDSGRSLPPVTSDAAWEDPYPPPPPSRWRRLRWLGLIPAVLLLGLAALIIQDRLIWPADPEYQGRRLSEWMRDLTSPDPAQAQAARLAVIALGTNALPALQRHLVARDSTLGRWVSASQNRLPRRLWVPAMQVTRARDALERRWQAAVALAVLGPAAAPALPELVRALEDPEPRVGTAAAEALSRLGPPAWPGLAAALNSTNEHAFLVASQALHRAGTGASNVAPAVVAALLASPPNRHPQFHSVLARLGPAVVPPLSAALLETNTVHARVAEEALRQLIAREFHVLQAVANLLQAPDPRLRAAAARLLSSPAVWARTSVNALTAALSDPEPAVRQAAARALAEAATWTEAVTNAAPELRRLAASGEAADRAAAAAALETLATRGLRLAP